MDKSVPTTSAKVLVSDFDGTMTRHDFYKLAIDRLLPSDVPDYWSMYRAGTLSHFEALKSYFAAIRVSEGQVIDVVESMEIDPELSKSLALLSEAKWRVVIVSAGCEWYIRYLLASQNIEVEVLSNPGAFQDGKGLVMELPHACAEFSPSLGIDKEKVVRRFMKEAGTVAFAGDGFPDVAPARLVHESLRFARGDLANVLEEEGLRFHRFETWSDIATTLVPIGGKR